MLTFELQSKDMEIEELRESLSAKDQELAQLKQQLEAMEFAVERMHTTKIEKSIKEIPVYI